LTILFSLHPSLEYRHTRPMTRRSSAPAQSTINSAEIAQFTKDAAAWWDEAGPFAPLHALNPLRMKFMVDTIKTHGADTPKKSWAHLDVGCGGGLVAEPFARLGARVTGVDADSAAIRVARAHAAQMGLDINYLAGAVETLARGAKFDTLTALEIIEHVDHPDTFVAQIAARVKPGGLIFMSTLNRTIKSLLLGKIAAEYILGWVPAGTHDPRKFVKPSELAGMMSQVGYTPVAATGVCYHPVKRAFYADPHDLDVNYMMAFQKE
jgi:2-polyprenyl-6-hydroxyphenyl methylase / 3-demethylubiquinone-9 3-methyltransferase